MNDTSEEISLVNTGARPSTFDELCDYLASDGVGYSLWLGAGASISASGGHCPSWQALIQELKVEAQELGAAPVGFDGIDMPDQLDWISGQLGHLLFRMRLRERLVNPLLERPLRAAVLLDHALVGSRASQIVSFNIEMLTAFSFTAYHGGHPTMRPYLSDGQNILASMTGKPGPGGCAVYFPHGLLDTYGSCVMTRSEYDEHKASLAASTAVSLCLGGDLLILGMSLGDSYLRQAILSGRRWIRNVFWVDSSFSHREWARVSRVTCIQADHASTWSALATAFLSHDAAGQLSERKRLLQDTLPDLVARLARLVGSIPDAMNRRAEIVLQSPAVDSRTLSSLASSAIDLGIAIPASITSHPLWRPSG